MQLMQQFSYTVAVLLSFDCQTLRFGYRMTTQALPLAKSLVDDYDFLHEPLDGMITQVYLTEDLATQRRPMLYHRLNLQEVTMIFLVTMFYLTEDRHLKTRKIFHCLMQLCSQNKKKPVTPLQNTISKVQAIDCHDALKLAQGFHTEKNLSLYEA